MKKTKLFILSLMTLSLFTGCNNQDENLDLEFEKLEYTVESGDAIKVKGNKQVKYQIINNPYIEDITLNSKTGVFTFNDTIPNYTQVLAVASIKNKIEASCVVTLVYEYQESVVSFTNLSSYIVNGEYINAVSSKNYSMKYSLKEKVDGILIDSETGKVTFANSVKNNTRFIVVADSHGSSNEKEFYAMQEGFVKAITDRQALKKNDVSVGAIYPLDFSESDIGTNTEVLAVVNTLNVPLDTDLYDYYPQNQRLVFKPQIAKVLNVGTNQFKVITKRNSVSISLDIVTDFIYTAEDLAAINNTVESLSGHYILMNDIDLAPYLAEGGKGYNDGMGWTPIGLYTDTLDVQVATQFAFKGTFDGNGHVIKNLYSKRKDVASFNAGLFGYVTSTGYIKNVGVEGSLDISSYSGGLVGSNSGIIENCYANVNISALSGENAYRYLGGFVGNNFGTIKNSYSIGSTECDDYFGSFVGSNEGTIENCYSYARPTCTNFAGFGNGKSTHIQFTSEDQMKSFDWNSVFETKTWDIKTGQYPTLKTQLTEYSVRSIVLDIDVNSVFKGEKIDLVTNIYPESLQSQYEANLQYSIEGEGFFRIGNYVNTTNGKDSQVTIKVSLTVDGVTYKDEKTIDVYEAVSSLQITHNLTHLVAGKSYRLSADFTPTTAKEDKITYHLSGRYLGVTIVNDILTIADDFNLDSISFYAMSTSGVKSNVVTITVKKQLTVKQSAITIYEGETSDIEIQFNGTPDFNQAKVSVFGKTVAYSVKGNSLTISRNVLSTGKDSKVRILIELNDGSLYGVDAYYFSHEKYTLDSLTQDDIIYINSTEDYFKYFNADPTANYDSEKVKNYSKTFVLTADLDFKGKEIYAIGYGDNPFSGTFYGLGHTISNFKIRKNEKEKVEQSTSCYYGVGLFGALSGKIYDLNLENGDVSSNNFVGGLVGMLTDGYVENCHGKNLKVFAANGEYQYSADDVVVSKMIGKKYNGSVLCIYHDNSSLNTIG